MFKSSNLNLWLLETFWNPRSLWIWHISGLVTRNRHILDSFDPPLRYEACAILEKNNVKFQKKPDDGRAFAKSDVNSAGGIFSTFERFWWWIICAFKRVDSQFSRLTCNASSLHEFLQLMSYETRSANVFATWNLLFESISSQKVRKASNFFPAERGMKGLAFALDPDGYWIEIATCPIKFRSSRDQLGGGFKYLLVSPLLREDFQFD